MKVTSVMGYDYNLSQLRQTALGSVRAYLRKKGINPEIVCPASALLVLDDMCREITSDNKLFRLWYENASDNQIKLFKKEWANWLIEQRQRNQAFRL